MKWLSGQILKFRKFLGFSWELGIGGGLGQDCGNVFEINQVGICGFVFDGFFVVVVGSVVKWSCCCCCVRKGKGGLVGLLGMGRFLEIGVVGGLGVFMGSFWYFGYLFFFWWLQVECVLGRGYLVSQEYFVVEVFGQFFLCCWVCQ